MRIRTIKPEFWTHPVMARLPDDVQLLALALLSMADDHGYFHADPSIVRGSVMPFRENLASISGSLAKLSEVGWIEVSEHPEQGMIGKIAKWTLHQKVDHPRDSALITYFSRESLAKLSREPRVGMEGNGMDNTGPPATPKASSPKPKKEPAEMKKLTDEFTEAYELRFSQPYIFEPKDGVAAAKLLKHGRTVEVIIATARAAWDNDKDWSCRQAVTLPGLLSQWNAITALLNQPVETRKGNYAP